MILSAINGVTEKFPRFGNIFEQAVRDLKVIIDARGTHILVFHSPINVCGSRLDIDHLDLRAASLEVYGLLRMFC